MAFLEANRYLYLNTPLGDDKLLLRGFRGNEALNRLFSFQLDLLAENTTTVDFDKLIGQKVSFGVQGAGPGQTPRHLHGIVVELAQGARGARLTSYYMTVAPDIWKLSCKFRSRVFQHIKIPDLLKQLFTGFDAAYEIQGTFEEREYVVQYQETDLDFASRLMEEEGIYYFFKFTRGAHKLVLANTPPSHPDLPGGSQVIFETLEGGGREEDRIVSWTKEQHWGSGKYTLWDHHFQLPHKKLEAEQIVMDSVQAGKTTHKLKLGGNEELEVYENPGRYAQRFDGIDRSGGEKASNLQKIFDDNKRTTGIRMQQVETPTILIHGESSHWQLTPGHKFTLQRHFNADGQYVLTSVSHQAGEGGFISGEEEKNHYENSFNCIPYALKFRPPRVTRRPLVSGPQSAVVVGPPGEEIFTDKYGRVKVQFHWDREGKNNADSSCWLRVATSWAGTKWGSIHIPRIGQEVIVGFLEGDPDRPLVTGSVYNADMMPPYDLPANKTQSGIKSRSSKGAGAANYNEIMFEDLKGSELIRVHAEKDQLVEVENDRTVIVGHDESIKIEHDRTENVKNNETVTIEGSRKHAVEGEEQLQTDGDLHLTASKNQNEKVGMNYSRQVGMNAYDKAGMNYAMDAGMMIHLKAGLTAVIEAGMGLTIKSSGGSIDINPMGVFIKGNLVLINSGMANLSGCGSSPTSPTSPGKKKLDGLKAASSSSSPAAAAAAAGMAQQMQQQAQQAAAMATNLVQAVGQQAFGNVAQVASQALGAAQQAGGTTPGAAQQIQERINAAVAQAQGNVGGAADQAQAMMNTGMNAVRTGVQQAVEQTSAAVSQAEAQAAAAAQAAAEQMQNAAQQAQAAAAQAAAAGQGALSQALQQGQQMLSQAQAMEQQAQQQLQSAADQAQALAGQAQQSGQQALNQASQQLSQTANQAQQTAEAAASQAQAASNQLQQTAQQAAAQGQQQIADAAGQAQQEAQQAAQAAQQTAAQAQQAAQQAGQQADQMAQQTQQQMQQASQAAGQQVGQAAGQAQQQVNQAAQQATAEAQQAGQMSQQAAQQVQNQVGQASEQAAQTVSNTAGTAYQQAGSSVNQASQNMQNSMKGLGH